MCFHDLMSSPLLGAPLVFLLLRELDPRNLASPLLLSPLAAPRDRRAAVGLAGPVWAGLRLPLLPSSPTPRSSSC